MKTPPEPGSKTEPSFLEEGHNLQSEIDHVRANKGDLIEAATEMGFNMPVEEILSDEILASSPENIQIILANSFEFDPNTPLHMRATPAARDQRTGEIIGPRGPIGESDIFVSTFEAKDQGVTLVGVFVHRWTYPDRSVSWTIGPEEHPNIN